MKTPIISLLIVLLCGSSLLAQNQHFTTSGTIEFERRVNMFAIIKKSINADNETWYGPAFENYKKTQPQFKTMTSTLSFANNKTLFTPAPPAETQTNSWFSNDPAGKQINTVYTDLNTHISTTQKQVFEEQFLVKDTTRKITWKITDETREIAGYTCRRANALVMDSIYVVAFYTDEIAVSGGPESFTGLPGMILGLALPHENITWFATKVVDTSLPEGTVKAPTKGKAVNDQELEKTLKSAIKNWGDEAQSYYKAFLL
ncbi:GLPGLI family protein [Mucilaginibacter segetis]|uniref:GLPGLI family protein n=1 Tax=Mucilaginibacter segetis TaxID=2793071 RepID=A0A934PT77_9SPHI|nr:GLPGLI family protein [Mucilaginibacter segetis]MBK0380389.1 GLPGLI family protein [Mucilaginibacter segetis]